MEKLAPALTHQQAVGGTYTAGGQLMQLSEDNPELRWPNSVAIYDRMRKDAKCASVLRAATLPARATPWHVVDSPDVRPAVAQFVRNQLGLTEDGDSRRRRRGQGVSWDHVLRHALLMLPFGHMFFEPVFTVGPPGPNDQLPAGNYAHLAKMAPVLPRTISGFHLDDLGDLLSIDQSASVRGGKWQTKNLPADLLIPVINDMEGSDWTGVSILRTSYKHWFLKDQLERLGSMIVERNGMGIPSAEFAADADRNETMRALSAMRAGDLSAAAFPTGSNFRLVGVQGSTTDPLPLIEYHGQEIARSVLAMFLDLGHDNGARALGDTFVDFFTVAINGVLADLEETFTEQLSRRLVELNFGPNEAYPEIAADEITPQAPLTAEALSLLTQAGLVSPDPTLEGFIRHNFGMPPASDAPPVVDTTTAAVGEGQANMSGVVHGTLAERESRIAALRERIGLRRRPR